LELHHLYQITHRGFLVYHNPKAMYCIYKKEVF
jgi:hypothetical protein